MHWLHGLDLLFAAFNGFTASYTYKSSRLVLAALNVAALFFLFFAVVIT
jgi:hypothetical protein